MFFLVILFFLFLSKGTGKKKNKNKPSQENAEAVFSKSRFYFSIFAPFGCLNSSSSTTGIQIRGINSVARIFLLFVGGLPPGERLLLFYVLSRWSCPRGRHNGPSRQQTVSPTALLSFNYSIKETPVGFLNIPFDGPAISTTFELRLCLRIRRI